MTRLTSSAQALATPNSDTDFASLRQQVAVTLEADMTSLLAGAGLPALLHDACLYALLGPGKRARPLLVACSYLTVQQHQQFGEGTNDLTLPSLSSNAAFVQDSRLVNDDCRRAMLAAELLHAYSLIHDDMPCMDDDDLRRGRPTCHIAFDEATALLAGDVLQTLAFEVLTSDISGFAPISQPTSCDLLTIFSPRARRMVIGQALDLQAENKHVTQAELEAIHRDKTGALIEAAVLMGALCAATNTRAGAETGTDSDVQPTPDLTLLQQFAAYIGLAFQVQDDILDVTASTDILGKPAGSDEKLDKSTYVKLMGVDGANDYAKSLFNQATTAIGQYYGQQTPLNTLAAWLWQRQK